MEKLMIDAKTGEIKNVPFNQEEIAQREADRLAWEQEQSKPKPPTEIDYLLDLDYRLSMIELEIV